MIIALMSDLLFRSKVKETAHALGVEVVFVRSAEALDQALKAGTAQGIIVDLHATALSPIETLKKALPTVPAVAYGSHVEIELLEQAKELGANAVLPRSAFTAQLAQILQGAYFSAHAPSEVNASSSVKTIRNAESGIGKFTALVFGAILVALIYSAYHILPMFYDYYELQNHFEQMVKVARTDSDLEIRNKLMYYIKKYQLPVEPDDLIIERSGSHMRISLEWSETFYIPWQDKDIDIHTFDFHAEAEDEF